MPRTTSENTKNSHPGSATKSTKKVTIKNGSGIPTIEERLGLFNNQNLFFLFDFFKDIYVHHGNYWNFIEEKLLNMTMKEMIWFKNLIDAKLPMKKRFFFFVHLFTSPHSIPISLF